MISYARLTVNLIVLVKIPYSLNDVSNESHQVQPLLRHGFQSFATMDSEYTILFFFFFKFVVLGCFSHEPCLNDFSFIYFIYLSFFQVACVTDIKLKHHFP